MGRKRLSSDQTGAAATSLTVLVRETVLFAHVALALRRCDEACNSPNGDMFDIERSWVKAPGRTFLVAADPATGAVMGCTAVARGGVNDMMSHSSSDAKAPKELTEPDACSARLPVTLPHPLAEKKCKSKGSPGKMIFVPCSLVLMRRHAYDFAQVWKVSTAKQARGKGVARVLMEAAERWAADTAGAKRMVLVTASPGAKLFYRTIGCAAWPVIAQHANFCARCSDDDSFRRTAAG